MKATSVKTQQRRDWLDEVFEYEASHPIAFASPRALMEARLIAELDKARRPRPAQRGGVQRRGTLPRHPRGNGSTI
jgi:hypothetical protein